MARKPFARRIVLLLVSIAVAYVLGKFGVRTGLWDGPLGG